jgi:hypothetical protein
MLYLLCFLIVVFTVRISKRSWSGDVRTRDEAQSLLMGTFSESLKYFPGDKVSRSINVVARNHVSRCAVRRYAPHAA